MLVLGLHLYAISTSVELTILTPCFLLISQGYWKKLKVNFYVALRGRSQYSVAFNIVKKRGK